ncbi:MAG: HD domain-containing protein [Proteobacteria bacterium]|nr:HD domain-containing protein [Pseudomonadota bacterium]
MKRNFFQLLKKKALQKEKEGLSPYGVFSEKAFRFKEDKTEKTDHRLPFAIDADRILYSKAYARYIDKTQVFSLVPNDHITHRALHVQFLSKISRTIGSLLGLNLDLIEAVSLGHDIGHPPFGHDGEEMLSALSERFLGKKFYHNVNSIRVLEYLEKGGKGLNLTFHTIDGILCHNGEEDYIKTEPDRKTGRDKIDETIAKIERGQTDYSPSTLEGCLVKICDTISYVGRDLEDAITLKLIKREDIPEMVVKKLGNTAGKIVFNLVIDIIENSLNKPYISMSEDTANALFELKNFNRERVYKNKKIKREHDKIKKMMEFLFEETLKDIEKRKKDSPIFRDFIVEMDENYIEKNSPPQIALDYIASMTDRYFIDIFKEKFVALPLPRYFS